MKGSPCAANASLSPTPKASSSPPRSIWPLGKPTAFALFAHCFTCGKDNLAAKRIAERLTIHGIAVLRFDFTGLGASEGEFANTHFSSNVDDLVAAADHLRKMYSAPAILIGHSLGGAAVLAAAHRIAEARAVVTIAAPYDPAHVIGLFKEHVDTIKEKGELEVQLAGRPFTIKREFLADVAEKKLNECLAGLRKALLVFHSPTDDLVGIDNASHIFVAAKHPKSFVSLAGADHLLSKAGDAVYVANVIAAWADRYLDQPGSHDRGGGRGRSGAGARDAWRQIPAGDPDRAAPPARRRAGQARRAEQRARALRFPARRLGRLHLDDHPALCRVQEDPARRTSRCGSTTRRRSTPRTARTATNKVTKVDHIERAITLEGPLDAAQRKKLMEIADKCPVHQTLESKIDIHTVERPA